MNNTDWKVIRGIKPNTFEIYRDDKLLDQSHSIVDQQKVVGTECSQDELQVIHSDCDPG